MRSILSLIINKTGYFGFLDYYFMYDLDMTEPECLIEMPVDDEILIEIKNELQLK